MSASASNTSSSTGSAPWWPACVSRGEFGLRLALGARPGAVVGMVVRGALGLATAGVALGALGAIWASRFLTSLLFGTAPTDVTTLAAVSLLLLLVAASAA